ncbi:hypothetical protein, partial [Micromonospora deserti]
MIFRRSGRPADRVESDRLLDAARAGLPASPDAGEDPLARLLSAAAGPARVKEVAGEEAALAAFRAARSAAPRAMPAVPPPRRRFTSGAIAWGAGIAVAATAGAAFAAVTLDRPDAPAPPSQRPATPAPTSETDPGPSTGAAGVGTGAAVPGPPGGTSGAPASGPRTPVRGEHVPGLCRAYLAKPPEQRNRALDTPAYQPVVDAAGGRAQVAGFCRDMVGGVEPERSKKAEPSAKPSNPADPVVPDAAVPAAPANAADPAAPGNLAGPAA